MNFLAKVRTLKNTIEAQLSKKFSIVYFDSDDAGWVLDYEKQELGKIFSDLKIKNRIGKITSNTKQCVHFTDQFVLRQNKFFSSQFRKSLDYFHGRPGTEPGFTEIFENLKKNHNVIDRIRVSHQEMMDVILSSGIDRSKVFKIPIGIDPVLLAQHRDVSKNEIRTQLKIPQSAVVIGSFQKDGNGWGEGLEPKLIKGPDVFLKTIEILKDKIPGLFVLLTGPARGFVKKGLEKIGVPYVHHYLDTYFEIGKYFRALDLYIVASRQEGGPKAILESMAAGVPLVTTRVGQAIDLVQHGLNGYMVDVNQAEELAFYSEKILSNADIKENFIKRGLITANENSYIAQTPLWKTFLKDYIEN